MRSTPHAGNSRTGTGTVTPFFVLAFGITWLLQLPGVFAQRGLLPGDPNEYLPFAMLGIFGPLVAATVVTAREGGRPALRELYAGLWLWRAPLRYYLVGILLPGLLLTGTLWLLRLAGREGPIAYLPDSGRLVAAVVISVAEEVGWRGFALPRLQKKLGAFAASGVLGMLWMLWHIPMFLGQGIPLSLLLVMSLYFTGGSLVFTWLYNGSGGSLLLAVLAHLGIHLDNAALALPGDAIPLVVSTVVYAALGLSLLRPRSTRGYADAPTSRRVLRAS